ncbi:IclR family transcriptional regulator [Margalitia sp. FSL K6-0131]|uniref:IclR family transcriptional regulator n=1 Tax=Margalitia sp. FSL K6-0131 TaxID=2954604 RepID=UPI0030F61450
MIGSIHKICKILDCFTNDEVALGNSEIAEKLNMNPSTVHHLVSTLYKEGILIKDSQNKYRLGWRLLEWSKSVMYQQDIYNGAAPLIGELVKSFNGVVHIGMLDEKGNFVFVLKMSSRHAIEVPTYIGERKPTYCFSTGKALLSFNPALLQTTIKSGLMQRGPNTITSIDRLQAEVDNIRNKGYAISNNENEYGIYGIAAPIKSYTGQTVAALNMVGPISYMQGREHPVIVQSILSTAKEISKELGYLEM